MAEDSAAASEAPKGAEEVVVEKEEAKPVVDEKKTVETKNEEAAAAETAAEKKSEASSDEKAADAEAAADKKTEDTSEPLQKKASEEKPATSNDEDPIEEGEKEEETAGEKEEHAVTGRGRRVRKPTQTYLPVEEKERKVLEVPEGKGEKLKDIPNVVKNFKNVTWSSPHLKMLHSIVFGGGRKKEFKEHLFQFSGLVYTDGDEEEEQDKIKEKMYKLTMPELKAVMDLVDIDRSKEGFGLDKNAIPGKEAHCSLFLEWLEKPKASGKKAASKSKKSPAAKRKSTDSAKGSAKKAKKTTPAKMSTSAKKTPPAKKSTSAKKAKPTKKPAKKTSSKSPAKGIDFDIPGVDIEKVREKVKTIVDSANREELTVKGVRKLLEDWLDTDLSEHKDAVRSIVMEVM